MRGYPVEEGEGAEMRQTVTDIAAFLFLVAVGVALALLLGPARYR